MIQFIASSYCLMESWMDGLHFSMTKLGEKPIEKKNCMKWAIVYLLLYNGITTL